MFTGIVQGCLPVSGVSKKPNQLSFSINLPSKLEKNVQKGASISIDGVCFTVASKKGNTVTFDAMKETLDKTTVKNLEAGTKVNIERSAKANDEVGGHLVSGHVSGVAKIVAIEKPLNNYVLVFRIPKKFTKYIFKKGFIALDGCSLTIVDVSRSKNEFTVWFIPETLRSTTFGYKQIGDEVNFEIDSRTQIMVDTIEQCLKDNNK